MLFRMWACVPNKNNISNGKKTKMGLFSLITLVSNLVLSDMHLKLQVGGFFLSITHIKSFIPVGVTSWIALKYMSHLDLLLTKQIQDSTHPPIKN